MKKESIKDFFEKPDVVNGYLEDYPQKSPFLEIIKEMGKNKRILALGCRGGREVKELVKMGHKVTAIDFAINMIKESKKIEPDAKYYCIDARTFAEKNKKKLKFDYILGLFSFLNYIPREDRGKLIENLHLMINSDGKIIFTVGLWGSNWKYILKALIAPFFALGFREIRKYEFGDIYNRYGGVWCCSHQFTSFQLERILKKYKKSIKGEVIYITK